MKLMKKKTQRRLAKQMRKLVRKHGEEVVTGLLTTAVSAEAAKSAAKVSAPPAADEPKVHKKDKKHTDVSPSMISV